MAQWGGQLGRWQLASSRLPPAALPATWAVLRQSLSCLGAATAAGDLASATAALIQQQQRQQASPWEASGAASLSAAQPAVQPAPCVAAASPSGAHQLSPHSSQRHRHHSLSSWPLPSTGAAGAAGPWLAGWRQRWQWQRGVSTSVGTAEGPGRGQTVAVGISGGVDSAVAAMLLKEQGYNVVGVFMRNWDEGEEVGNQNCSVERDARDAAVVCRQLGISLHEADFVSKYWTQVFEGFLAQCARGLTPNPDLACNRHIKFDALLDFADSLGAGLVATGHYARLRHVTSTYTPAAGPIADSAQADSAALAGPAEASEAMVAGGMAREGASVQLLRGADPQKDQTYFLATIRPEAMQRVLFPVGRLLKSEVRRLASERGLFPADRRSSAGICFIGRRNFADFISQYLPPVPGTFVSVDTGLPLGPCPNVLTVTHGQRPGIGGAADRMYVVGKDVVGRVVFVCQGRNHPALLTRSALLRAPLWLSALHAARLAQQGWLACQYKARYGQDSRECILVSAAATSAAGGIIDPTAEAAAIAVFGGAAGGGVVRAETAGNSGSSGSSGASMGSESPSPGKLQQQQKGQLSQWQQRLLAAAGSWSYPPFEPPGSNPPFQPSAYTRLQPEDAAIQPAYLVAHFPEPAAAITPQQAFVLYEGEVCLGSALIAMPGRTLHEEAHLAA